MRPVRSSRNLRRSRGRVSLDEVLGLIEDGLDEFHLIPAIMTQRNTA